MQYQLIKQLPKTQLINSIKAIPDSIVTLTFIKDDKEVIISGKRNTATLQAIQ